MLKYIRIVFRCLWYVLYIYPTFLYYKITKNKTPYEKRYAKTQKTLIKLAKLLDVEYHVTGYENLDPNQNYYFAPNHQSFFDALSMIILLENRHVRCVAKEESIKMPVAGKLIYAIDSLFLDRDDLRQAVKIMREAGNILQNTNQDVLIFPEGTRTKSPTQELNEFKSGSLKPAFYAKKTIVPVCLVDTYTILSSKIRKKKYHVQVCFLDPIPYEEFEPLGTSGLAQLLKEKIENKYSELRNNKF